MKSLLLVEDNLSLRDMVREYLEAHGFEVRVASNGREGLLEARHHPPDLIVLDVMMPQLDGLGFLRAYREGGRAPVILLTARDSETEKIEGLESGADDYVTKPFSVAELLARVRAHLRRAEEPFSAAVLRSGELALDLNARSLQVRGQRTDLTRSEFELLHVLMEAPMRVYTRSELLEHLQEEALGSERTIDVHVRNLRVKIEEQPAKPRWLETVFGVGYRFNPGPDP